MNEVFFYTGCGIPKNIEVETILWKCSVYDFALRKSFQLYCPRLGRSELPYSRLHYSWPLCGQCRKTCQQNFKLVTYSKSLASKAHFIRNFYKRPLVKQLNRPNTEEDPYGAFFCRSFFDSEGNIHRLIIEILQTKLV